MSALEFIDDMCLGYDYVTSAKITSIEVLLNHLSKAKITSYCSIIVYLITWAIILLY